MRCVDEVCSNEEAEGEEVAPLLAPEDERYDNVKDNEDNEKYIDAMMMINAGGNNTLWEFKCRPQS